MAPQSPRERLPDARTNSFISWSKDANSCVIKASPETLSMPTQVFFSMRKVHLLPKIRFS
jgi:hypothetical protein